MVQVLRGKGGVGGLKAERAEAATTNALKHLLPAKTASDGALHSDRHGNCSSRKLFSGGLILRYNSVTGENSNQDQIR